MIDKITLLEKIIYIQSRIIEGKALKYILSEETPFFKETSGANVIAICMENKENVDIELVLEDKEKFLPLLKKYNLVPKHIKLRKFIEQCNSHFSQRQEKIRLESMYDIFHGSLSKKKSSEFEEEMDFSFGYIFPIRNKTNTKIGFVIYFFTQGSQEPDGEISQLSHLLEVLLRPFYDEDNHILNGKCIQIDEKMQRLTDKERQIAHRVLLGRPHKVIADEMDVSINTLKTHMKNIFSKYGVSSKIELHNKLKGSV